MNSSILTQINSELEAIKTAKGTDIVLHIKTKTGNKFDIVLNENKSFHTTPFLSEDEKTITFPSGKDDYSQNDTITQRIYTYHFKRLTIAVEDVESFMFTYNRNVTVDIPKPTNSDENE